MLGIKAISQTAVFSLTEWMLLLHQPMIHQKLPTYPPV